MTDLSATQREVLTTALARKDRCLYPITAKLKGGAVGNVARSLLKRGLVEEVPAGKSTVWRHGEDGKPLTLRAADLAASILAPTDAPKRPRGRHVRPKKRPMSHQRPQSAVRPRRRLRRSCAALRALPSPNCRK
jgi:hypothetical protein